MSLVCVALNGWENGLFAMKNRVEIRIIFSVNTNFTFIAKCNREPLYREDYLY